MLDRNKNNKKPEVKEPKVQEIPNIESKAVNPSKSSQDVPIHDKTSAES